MTFLAGADAYDRFMGRYSTLLAPRFADFAGITAQRRVLDVGCGPGALTAELVARVGAGAVAAVDPTEAFVAAARERHPGVQVLLAGAEELPFADASFDVTLAQLVVAFVPDPVAGLAEMRRVTRPGGTVAACTWDHGGGETPLAPFWDAVREADPAARAGEAGMPGGTRADLVALFREAGFAEVESSGPRLTVEHATFEEWWDPFLLGVGPAGQYLAKLGSDAAEDVRERCRALLGDGPLTVTAQAWAARAKA